MVACGKGSKNDFEMILHAHDCKSWLKSEEAGGESFWLLLEGSPWGWKLWQQWRSSSGILKASITHLLMVRVRQGRWKDSQSPFKHFHLYIGTGRDMIKKVSNLAILRTQTCVMQFIPWPSNSVFRNYGWQYFSICVIVFSFSDSIVYNDWPTNWPGP